jgi:hypothetical protein
MIRSRVLLLADSCTGCLAAVRGLRAAGYEPWVGVTGAYTYAARSRAAGGVLRLPHPDRDVRYAERVAELSRELGVVAVLPGTMDSLVALTGREHLFGAIAVGTSGPEALRRATDPDELARVAADNGARMLSPGRRRVVASRSLDPEGESELCAVSGVVSEGRVQSVLHQNGARVWESGGGIAAYCETLPPQPERETVVSGILQALGWSGIFHFPLLDTPKGLWLVGFTPCVWGSFALPSIAGHNLASAWVDLLLGRELELGPYRVGVGLRAEERDYPALLSQALDGAPWGALSELRPSRRIHHAVLSVRDPAPAVILALRLTRAAARLIRQRRAAATSPP